MTVDELIELILRSPQHNHVYHFTDSSNFETINERGLLSKAIMQSEGWWPQKTGGNQLSHEQDTKRGIYSCVSLCFTSDHPMEYVARNDGRLPNSRYLKISPFVLKLLEVRIALGVANAADTEILPIEDAIERLDIDVMYRWTDWSSPEINRRLTAAKRYEILVLDTVPRKLIKGVV